jgi:hypothetical protein
MIVENYLKMLNERRSKVGDSAILYHGSRIQNLKVIDPEKWVDALLVEHVATIWASWDKKFASMFCIDWRKNIEDIFIGTDIGFYRNLRGDDERHCYYTAGLNKEYNRSHCFELEKNPSWMVVVPTRYKQILTRPCSLYLIKGKNWIVPKKIHGTYPWDWPEAYSKEPAEVIKEIKYSSVTEAYEKNNVKLLVENNYKNSKWWNRIFSKLKS